MSSSQCEICSSSIANLECLDCPRNSAGPLKVCNTCSDCIHRGTSSNHSRRSIQANNVNNGNIFAKPYSQNPRSKLFCEIHQQPKTLVCTIDNILLCDNCAISRDPKFITTCEPFVANCKSSYGSYSNILSHNKSALHQLLIAKSTCKNEAERKVNEYFSHLIQTLETKRAEILSQLSTRFSSGDQITKMESEINALPLIEPTNNYETADAFCTLIGATKNMSVPDNWNTINDTTWNQCLNDFKLTANKLELTGEQPISPTSGVPPKFHPVTEIDTNGPVHFMTITAMPEFRNLSLEELRWDRYRSPASHLPGIQASQFSNQLHVPQASQIASQPAPLSFGGHLFNSPQSVRPTSIFNPSTTATPTFIPSFSNLSISPSLPSLFIAPSITRSPKVNGGTGVPSFKPTKEENNNNSTTEYYQNICFMEPFESKSVEELRWEDYSLGKKDSVSAAIVNMQEHKLDQLSLK